MIKYLTYWYKDSKVKIFFILIIICLKSIMWNQQNVQISNVWNDILNDLFSLTSKNPNKNLTKNDSLITLFYFSIRLILSSSFNINLESQIKIVTQS
jgi:hypothetical protein